MRPVRRSLGDRVGVGVETAGLTGAGAAVAAIVGEFGLGGASKNPKIE